MIELWNNEHFEIVSLFENIKSIDEIKYIDNKYIKSAIEIIKGNEKLTNILKNDIGIDINDLINVD